MSRTHSHNRRQFLSSAASTAAGLSFLSHLPHVSRAEATLTPGMVRFTDDIEPLVRLIEETPRQRLLEQVAQKIQSGTTYREVLAALLYAGVRNVQPRPSVGFKFHCVLVVNSCHLASLAGPDEDRWLPIFWAIDYFKDSQADEARRSGWHLQAVNESQVPTKEKARQAFIEAMESWDVEQADVATAAIVRHLPRKDVFNLFAQYAARDFRSIGHKAIYLANGWRTLDAIGWENAEPVLRSLTFALLNHQGESNPSDNQHAADLAWRVNEPRATELGEDWNKGQLDDKFTRELIQEGRTAAPANISELVASAMLNGVGPQSVWDGVFMSAMELLMRQPGIVGLHGLTTANAVRFIYDNTDDELLKRKLLLQASSFNPYFRESAKGRGQLSPMNYDTWEEKATDEKPDVESIIAEISSNKLDASMLVRKYLSQGGAPAPLIDEARRQIFLRGRNAHDYKYSSAVLEDFSHLSPTWRDDYLALSVFSLKGSNDRQSPLVERTRAAIG